MSEEQRKGVTVEVMRGVSREERSYPTALRVRVIEGHLHVIAAGDAIVGVHAPGQWLSADVAR